MRVKSITICGFRGFNEERSIDFHSRLTLISASNSYGKTSISEAFEWLLYGTTSKVAKALSKEEYKGSYRNRHFDDDLTPYVKAVFTNGETEIELLGVLAKDETITRYFNSREVEEWPLQPDLLGAPKPFVLQHALKYLLLAKPDERFKGFAHLLGLEKLEKAQEHIVSLCTKPDACFPPEIKEVINKISQLQLSISRHARLALVAKDFKRRPLEIESFYEQIGCACRTHVGPDIEEHCVRDQLVKVREEAISSLFKGRLSLPDFSEDERRLNADDDSFLLNFVTDDFVRDYLEIIGLSMISHIVERARFLKLGIQLLDRTAMACPFCGQVLDEPILNHIEKVHEDVDLKQQEGEKLHHKRQVINESLSRLRKRIENYQSRCEAKAKDVLALESSIEQLEKLLLPEHKHHFEMIQRVIASVKSEVEGLRLFYNNEVVNAFNAIDESIAESKEHSKLASKLGEALTSYIAFTRRYSQLISQNAPLAREADSILQEELDKRAGTEDLSILIELLDHRPAVGKYCEICTVLDSLRELKRQVEKYVSNKVLQEITDSLTTEVMDWYEQIKTSGDPEVHFSGFDMGRTKENELKARRVKIKASSYGKELVSAVSSLSESKLNALGLCMSIATNLKGQSPFDFLIIDDPIQSWDAEHEVQFINIIRKLVEALGKQVIVMSHNQQWVNRVRDGCRTLNGWFYEISSYTQAGPHIKEIPWVQWKDRLNEVDGIIKDPEATTTKLQQAEEEIRIVIAQLASDLYLKKKGIPKASNNLNSRSVRKLLIECGVDERLIDRITESFETTDNAHHASINYSIHRERVRQYYNWAYELAGCLNQ